MNPLPLKYHPHAEFEIDEAFEWYLVKKRSPSAASRLLDELEMAFGRIAADPDRWPLYLGGARRFTLRHFPYHTWSIRYWIRSFWSSRWLMSAVVLANWRWRLKKG